MAEQPNIVFIMADDMGFGDIGCYNPESRIPTPNMDRLAAGGMSFLDAHSASAVCTPSRYGILTGRYCWRTRLKHGVLYGYEPPLIEPDRLTVGGLLKGAGYTTACIGKWHLGLGYSGKLGADLDFGRALPWGNATREFEEQIDFAQPIEGGPTALGFDYFFGCSGCPTCQPPYGFIENDGWVETPSVYVEAPPHAGRAGYTAPGWQHKDADPTIGHKAAEYVEQQKDADEPFFLYLASDACHEPCVEEVVPEFARGKSRAGHRGDLVWLYDWMVGRVMDALERTGQAENTLIMVTSDNGALPGDRFGDGAGDYHGYHTYGHRSCKDWRGYKAHIWEGGHREPLIARWPGRVAAGSTCDQLVGLQDLMATCAAITGAELPPGAAPDSVDILPLLLDEPHGAPPRDSLIHHSGTGVFSVRKGPWKLIHETLGSGGWPPPRGGPPEPGTPGQLYNLADDPAEENNLWGQRQDKVAELLALLEDTRGRG
jgi:arylsulfatase A-like enzyme